METMSLQQKASPREQILALLVVLSLLLLFFRVIYFPNQATQKTLESQTENLILERDALQKFNDALVTTVAQTMPKDATSKSDKMQILGGRKQPVAEAVSTLLRILTTHDFLGGVTVKKMSDIPAISGSGFKKTGFFIEINGHFRDIMDYLDRVQALAALITVDQITVKMSEAKAAKVDLELNGTLFEVENIYEPPAT